MSDNRITTVTGTSLATLLPLAALILTAAPARANPEPPPIITDIVQNGGDVELELYHWFEPYESWEPILLCRNLETNRLQPVLEDQELEPYGPWDCEGYCATVPDLDWCADQPDECTDCDGDETPECPGMCNWDCLMTVVDECVPAGEFGYGIYEWEGTDCVQEEEHDFTVEDLDQDCPEGALEEHDCHPGVGGDSDGDSDLDGDSDIDDGCGGDGDSGDGDTGGASAEDDGAGSCAVSGTGRSPGTRLLLVLLMLGIGGAVLSCRK